MVSVKLIKTEDSLIGLTVKGHANSNEYGKDLVCAAISSIVVGGFNAMHKEDFQSVMLEEGYAQVILKNTKCYSKTVLDVILVQLQTIAEEYPKYVKIN